MHGKGKNKENMHLWHVVQEVIMRKSKIVHVQDEIVTHAFPQIEVRRSNELSSTNTVCSGVYWDPYQYR